MEPYYLDHDITLLCLKADSFPEGVMPAWERLFSLLGSGEGRHAFGISWSDGKGGIVYKAAVQEHFAGEAQQLGFETHVVKKGAYSSIFIPDFASDMQSFGRAFSELITDPRLDPEGMCVEMYPTHESVRCMVRLDPAKAAAAATREAAAANREATATREAAAPTTANTGHMPLPKP